MHANFFAVCSQVAETSDDPNTQVGCLFINNSNEIIAKGANTLVAGCTNTKERTTRPAKYSWLEHAERNAINAPIQGSAADIIKIAMINIHDEMKKRNLQSKMLLQVHDELVFDLFIPEQDEMIKLVTDKMENAIEFAVPLKVEFGIADNWLDAH